MTASPGGDLFLCGWRVRSDLALPELTPWIGDDREADLTIRIGAIPSRLDDARDVSPLLQVTSQKQARLSIDGVASYWLRSSHEIVVDPQMAADSPDIRTFLFGTVLGLLVHCRGLMPLHASCIRIGGKGVAISGMSGAGKSTLAAALTRRGHALVSDDICVIDTGAAGGPVVRPAFPRVKLWQDSLEAMGLGSDGLEANRFGQRKYYLRFAGAADFHTEPVSLKAVFLLRAQNVALSGQAEIQKLPPMAAVAGLNDQIYRKRTAAIWGREGELFQAIGQIVSAADVYRLSRRTDFSELDSLLRCIEDHVAS
ncbi:hypothetical protein [Bradyrhizobium sp. MOS003]|uniref:HPr kinase/phosphorylase n=1 Tax=Bradyrhizobium sp. MOS003 TaxID=2133946 RepID=UPI001314BA34|nr:hypothetical protein [Bradyrhizobium sp. MOS003]